MSKDSLRDNRENISKSPGLPSSDSTDSSNNKEYNSIPSDRFYTLKEEVTVAVSMNAELPIDGLATTVHTHPTLSEAVMEAAEDCFGIATHKA